MKYVKTEIGQQAFKARSALFSSRQRMAFILFDGNKSTDQVVAAAVGLGLTHDDVDYLVGQGFLALAAGETVLVLAKAEQAADRDAVAKSFLAHPAQERYKAAKPLATKLTAGLGLRGFRLNLAVEAAGGFDELLALLPKIKDAVGSKACLDLEHALTQ